MRHVSTCEGVLHPLRYVEPLSELRSGLDMCGSDIRLLLVTLYTA